MGTTLTEQEPTAFLAVSFGLARLHSEHWEP